MLGWMIPTLACIGYFLYEARRAPIIEDDGTNDHEPEPFGRSQAPHFDLQTAEPVRNAHAPLNQ